ncbi:MAG: DUF2807 domain-containing protein [Cyclobacteriaceae bacterium]|nr:DUF2807 domain-containing protein [Cyclobacteriaceae bacterium]
MNNLRTISNVLALVAVLLAAQSCYIHFEDDGYGCVQPRGPVITQSYNLPSFDRITNAIGADITLRQSNNREFEITAAESILEQISLRIVDGELIIDNLSCISNTNIEIFAAMPDIEAVHNVGSGDIFGDNIWEVDDLELRITGSGKIDAEFIVDYLSIEITGSGTMDLFGEAHLSEIRISGSGDVHAFGMEANDQDIIISGSGNCEVLAIDHLDVVISGSGNVFYKGNPQVSVTISGSGTVIDAN